MPKRIATTLALLALFALMYFGIANLCPGEGQRSLATWLDEWIPFAPAAVFLYAWVYTGALLPLFTIRTPALFQRVVWAYVLVFAICAAGFILLPVSATTLRPLLLPIDDPSFTEWSIRTLYSLDPPTNLFPSLHVAIAFCAATASWKADKRYGVFVFPWLAAVSVSTCLTKQHYAVDVAAGLVVGAVALHLSTRSLRVGSEDVDASVRLGAPIALQFGLVLVFYMAFLIGTSGAS